MPRARRATVARETRETKVSVSIDLDGSGRYDIKTGNGMFDHLLSQLSRHSLIDITVQAQGDLETGPHHLVEDVGIVLGQAMSQALGERAGIRRMGDATVPLDEALASVAVDLVGRSYVSLDLPWAQQSIEGVLPADMVRHFLDSFAREARITLHARLLAGLNTHHQAEALFKALARALRQAVELDPRGGASAPSTKGRMV